MTTPQADLPVIRERMVAPFMAPPDPEHVRRLRAQLEPNGTWPDVNYSGTCTTTWEPAEHLKRLQLLAQAWFSPSSATHGNPELASDIGRALDFWLETDLRRPWWWDCIGAPGFVSLIMLLFESALTGPQKAKGCAILERAILGDTGQNLIWQAEITARRAALQKDPALMKRAFDLIFSEIRISDEEGVQADFSFHQHGPCLYNHGYGRGFAIDNARLAAMTAGTAFAYPQDKIRILSAYILDGSQRLAFGRHSNFSADGREITRPNRTAKYLGMAAMDMRKIKTGRESEFDALIARIAGEQAPPLVGNKHFHRSDIMVHHRPGWYMSARMYSTRTMNTDQLSGCYEGLLSHYLSEGATCIMTHGNEYMNIYPVWDWQRVPGTTVELAPHIPGEPARKGESAFAGGASDGTAGVAAFDLKRDALRARKAWFFFSNAVICLGSGINCSTGHEVVTTLNQCRLTGPLIAGRGKEAETLDEGERMLNANWAWHDNIGYVFDKTLQISLAGMTRTGSWKRISTQRAYDPQYGVMGSVTDKVFMLGLSHGVRPTNADYAYAVLPGAGAKAMPGLAQQPPFVIASNSSAIQAVFHPADAALGIVFYEPGQFDWQGWQVTVDRACALVIRREGQAWHMAAADPCAGTGQIRVNIARPDKQRQALIIKLPEGQYAGASTVTRLQ